MRSPLRILAALLGLGLALTLAGLAGGAWAKADGYSAAASRVLAQARAAMGGAGWNQLRGWRETGTRDGLAYELRLDPLRWGLREETHEAEGKRLVGFNGLATWQVAPDGAATATRDKPAVSRAKTQAFIDGWLFFFPSRIDGRGAYVGVRALGGRSFEVITVQPAGGAPRELWFDRRTHLLARIVDRTGPKPQAVAVSDYRKVGPVRVPFRFEAEPGTPASRGRRVETLVFAPSDRELFSLPPPPPPPPVVAAPTPEPPPPEPPKKKRRWPFGRR